MTDSPRSSWRTLAAACFLTAASAGAAHATTWLVPGDLSNTCTVATPSCDTIAAAIAASADGDSIQVAAGTFNENNLVVDKSLVITGAGANNTTLNAAGGYGFSVRDDNVTITQMEIEAGSDGIRIEPGSGDPVTGTTIEAVLFQSLTSDGVEFSVNEINDTIIHSAQFVGGVNGVRMASNSQVENLTISDSAFTNNTGVGIYQANDGATSTLDDLTVQDNTFTGNGVSGGTGGIYAEELSGGVIEGNTFTDNFRGILIIKLYNTSGATLDNIAIRDNEFSGTRNTSIAVASANATGPGAGENIVIEDNTITQDVADLTVNNIPLIDVGLLDDLTHNLVTVRDNYIQLSGTFGSTTAVHGIRVRGDGPIAVTGNILLGGDVGGSGTTPPSSGIQVRTQDSFYGLIPADAAIDITCNRIEAFVNGISVWDAVGGQLGGLSDAAILDIDSNTISGNSGAGVANGATPTVDAENNYWGCEDGPGNPGCDTVVGAVDADPALAEPAACVACLANSECDDGLTCTGIESCNLDTFMCESGTALECDDDNECTTESCVEPGGCQASDVADDTLCDDGVTCSVPDTCQSGVCEAGAEDLDMSGTCDIDEADEVQIQSASLKAQKEGNGKGKAGAKVTFVTDPPADTFDAGAPITVEIRDATLTGGEYTFSTAECVTKGTKINCKSTDKTAKATFKPLKDVPGGFSMKAKLKELSIDGPFVEPLRVTLTYGPGTIRTNTIGGCKTKPTSIKCKQ